MAVRKSRKPRKSSENAAGNKRSKPIKNTEAQTKVASNGRFPIVGIGASAGGLAAFEAFFSGMPTGTDPGMAFILVQHLAPNHKSILTDLVKRYTRMQVYEVEDGMVVQPNCTYIIPPGHDMAFLNGTLQLLEPSAPRGQRFPIDFFFRSLAQDQHERAICIVLSGTGSDGTLGVRAIKSEGGMVMVQNPESAEYDGMPRSVIDTGLVDYELQPAKMPAKLIAYVSNDFGKSPGTPAVPSPKVESALKKVFILLRAQTGHDFSLYKPSTINRRIERRLAVQNIETMDAYVKFLQQSPAEVKALFNDLLIGVTNFFRDPEAFKALEEQVIPKLFAGKSASATIRVWSPGCSTGEEAYSIAILMLEHIEALKQSYTVQIFATDIDPQAIATARIGLFPASIAADISPERLARFFTIEPDGKAYCIHKDIRDMLVFSEQDVIKDPPFSKLDLISCRNLMIYMGTELQNKLIPLFHYALNQDGILFLGTSETVGESGDLFATLDRKAKLYQRKTDTHSMPRVPLGRFLPPMMQNASSLPRAEGNKPVKLPLRELTEQVLLQQVTPIGVLVNAQGDILYLHGRTGRFLEPAPGETGINNMLKMAREGLRHELSMALRKAVATKEVVRCPGLRIKTNSHFTTSNLSIHRVEASSTATFEAPLFLVILEEVPPLCPEETQQVTASTKGADTDAESHIVVLKQELLARDEYLLCVNKELETSNEELKSSNEEIQSANEELRSTNEELETSKEELQSINEELATVNVELQTNVMSLSVANNDKSNMLAGTNIGTVFLDTQMRIRDFTPAAVNILNLIPSDMGRPVGHIASNLVGYNHLTEDAQAVLDTLISEEKDVQTTEGKWYTMRILPYRTLKNVIEGVVITFVEITKIVQMREALRRLAVIVRDTHDAITVQDLEGRILAWNPSAVRLYGWGEDEALTMNVHDRIPERLRKSALVKLHQLSLAKVLEPYRTQRIAKDGTIVEVWVTATALVNETGKMYAIATTERVIKSKAGRTKEARSEPQE